MKNFKLHIAIVMFICGNLNVFVTGNFYLAIFCYAIMILKTYEWRIASD